MLMKADEIKSCYIGPVISPEQFVAEHFFLYVVKGRIHGYDGDRYYTLNPGESCIVRKNSLARYNKEKEGDVFEKVVVVFDEAFLKKHSAVGGQRVLAKKDGAFMKLGSNHRIDAFIQSLRPHYQEGKIPGPAADEKRQELLSLLLEESPVLGDIFFDFGMPEKIDLEAFMNRNYKFNVGVERLAFLTGRSLSAFKRDFKQIYNETPNRWLIHRRLTEAHFLIEKEGRRPSEIYLELGFEDLSHFSFAFKKRFGRSPTLL